MIIRTRGAGAVEVRAFPDSMTNPPPRLADRAARVAVTPRSVAGVPAYLAGVRVAAWAVAMLKMRVWRGYGVDRRQVTTTWQARLFARATPNDQQTWFGFWEATEESLSARGNALWWKNIDPLSGQVVEVFALHPDQWRPELDGRRVRYRVTVAPGYVDPTGQGFGWHVVEPPTVLHLRGFGDGGAVMAPSPIERHRATLKAAIAKGEHEARIFDEGAGIRLAVEFPSQMTKEQGNAWRDEFKALHSGPDADDVLLLGGGVTAKPIGMTQSDAQFIESQQLSVDDMARILGVPASLIEAARGAKPITPEHELTRWLRYGLEPRLQRIQDHVRADPTFFGPAARDYPAFDTDGFISGDRLTEELILHQAVQDGRLLVDEARAQKGLPPLPNGAGAVPVINPAGAGSTPDQFLPKPGESGTDDEDEDDEEVSE